MPSAAPADASVAERVARLPRMERYGRIDLVAETAADARDVSVAHDAWRPGRTT